MELKNKLMYVGELIIWVGLFYCIIEVLSFLLLTCVSYWLEVIIERPELSDRIFVMIKKLMDRVVGFVVFGLILFIIYIFKGRRKKC